MLEILQKAKFSFQSVVIRNPHVSGHNLRFGNSENPTQTLKYKRAYLVSQVINYFNDVKSAHIATTFLMHY